MDSFFSELRYSVGNEDWEAEAQALRTQPEDRVLCITASGDRPLHVAMTDCMHVTAVDANPTQNYLLELKQAALRHLHYDHYIGFLGLESYDDRYNCYLTFADELSPDAQRYWQKNKRSLEKGVIYQGATERMTSLISRVLRYTRGSKLDRLFGFEDLHAQREFLTNEWNTPSWRFAMWFFLHPSISRWFIRDIGLNSQVDGDIHPGIYINERMQRAFESKLAKTNLLGSLICLGKLPPEAYPPYLTSIGHAALRESQSQITPVTMNVLDYLESCPTNSFDAFSMSDIASYMDQSSFDRLCRGMLHAAKPGARFSMRQFMTSHTLPEEVASLFVRDHALEAICEEQENNFVYRFMVGDIYK